MSTTYASRSKPGRPLQLATDESAPSILFRPDIEGLRAVAVVLVVLGHVGVGQLGGGYVGVDVFFVISGFLITNLLVKELSPSGSISLVRFYARRAARLLPASTVVLIATLVASWAWLPATRFHAISIDALASTFYGINWRLAAEGVDYLNASQAPSPLQHFWSLAVEEQFYLVWPLLLLTASWARRGHRTMNRLPIVLTLLLVIAGSLAWSVRQTDAAAPWAYFGAHTRAWELAVGALVAMAAAGLARTPAPVAALLAWAGLGAVLTAALIFDEGTPFPGYAAALPVLGAALVIAGGCAAPRGGPVVVLGTWPFQQLGKLSYGWYLWHWPVLMIAPAALGMDATSTLNAALAVAALVLAIASYHLVENPIRARARRLRRPGRAIGLGLGLSASTAALALFAGTLTPTQSAGSTAVDTAPALAAAADPAAQLTALITAGAAEPRLPDNLTPSLTAAGKDKPVVYADGCHLDFTGVRQRKPCVYGDPNGAQTMFLIGDSHAAHWFPALEAVARQRSWRLVALTKSACPVATVLTRNSTLKRPYHECVTWRDRVLDQIRDSRPAMVVMSANGGDSGGLVEARGDQDQAWVNAWRSAIRRIKNPKTRLVLVEDTPWPSGNVPECASAHPHDLNACARPVGEALVQPRRRGLIAAMARGEDVTVIDPTPWLCAASCPVVVGNILVYSDDSHLTTAYSRLLAPMLAAKLR